MALSNLYVLVNKLVECLMGILFELGLEEICNTLLE